MSKYFISFSLKYKDSQLMSITHYGNIIIDLPHEIEDYTDIKDLQTMIEKQQTELLPMSACILNIQKLPI